MRVKDHPVLGKSDDKPQVTIWVDGRPIPAREGEPIAAAMFAAGLRVFHRTDGNEARGVFCAIGRCTDCVMVVDGRPNVRTCVTPVRDGMQVRTQVGVGRWDGVQTDARN